MLVTIGSQLGVAFANASLNASEHKRASLMQHINRIGAALSGILEREELYKRVVFSIQRLLGYEAVYLLEAADSHLEIVAQAIGDDMAELLSEPPTLPLKGSSPGRAARTLRSFLIRDIDLDPDAEPPADLPFTARSELIVPIRSGESIIGVLDVYSSERGAFDESDREALEALATQIAIALENTALHIETQRRLKEQQIVHQISGDLNAILDIPRLADATVYQMAHALDTTGCLFALYDAEKDVITVRSMYVSPTATRQEALNELPWRQALSELPASFRTMLLMGSPLLVNLDAAEGDDLAFMLAYEQQGLLLMPMVAGCRPLGLIMLAVDRYPRHFDIGEVLLAQTLANHASVSLERARLHEATQRQLKRESLLRRLAETANNWVELDEMLDRFSREVCTALQATACTLYAFEEDHLTVRAQYSAPGALPAPAGSLKLEDYPALAVSLDRGKVLRVSFTTPGEDITGFEHLKEEGFTNVMVAPLVSRSRLLGAMSVLDDRASRWFSAADADLMEALATQVSIALDNANLFAELEERADELAVANQLKTEFLANISHELRTPMNSIIGFTDALVAGTYGELNDKQQDRIVKVRKNAGHLLTLINDLLDLSRIEAGRLSLEFESVDVPSVIDMICATIEPQIAAKGLDLIRDYAPDVPAASLDEQRFKQILINLLSNAIKFTEEGSITVRVQPAGEDVLQVNVIDTGIGISPEDKAIIFDEFRQVDGSSTRQYEGTGLGLAISRKLIEMMGGRIWVESALGEGSSFYLLIPTLKGESYE
ncbi:MAG: GAF domain-containing protein [Anaerolineae bacterium]